MLKHLVFMVRLTINRETSEMTTERNTIQNILNEQAAPGPVTPMQDANKQMTADLFFRNIPKINPEGMTRDQMIAAISGGISRGSGTQFAQGPSAEQLQGMNDDQLRQMASQVATPEAFDNYVLEQEYQRRVRSGEVPSIGADPLTAQQRRGVDVELRNQERTARTQQAISTLTQGLDQVGRDALIDGALGSILGTGAKVFRAVRGGGRMAPTPAPRGGGPDIPGAPAPPTTRVVDTTANTLGDVASQAPGRVKIRQQAGTARPTTTPDAPAAGPTRPVTSADDARLAAAQIGPQATRIAARAGAEGAETGAKTTARASDEVPELLARRETGTVGGVDADGTPRLLRRPGEAGGPVTRTGAEGAETAARTTQRGGASTAADDITGSGVGTPGGPVAATSRTTRGGTRTREFFYGADDAAARGARSTRADAPTGTRSARGAGVADDAARAGGRPPTQRVDVRVRQPGSLRRGIRNAALLGGVGGLGYLGYEAGREGGLIDQGMEAGRDFLDRLKSGYENMTGGGGGDGDGAGAGAGGAGAQQQPAYDVYAGADRAMTLADQEIARVKKRNLRSKSYRRDLHPSGINPRTEQQIRRKYARQEAVRQRDAGALGDQAFSQPARSRGKSIEFTPEPIPADATDAERQAIAQRNLEASQRARNVRDFGTETPTQQQIAGRTQRGRRATQIQRDRVTDIATGRLQAQRPGVMSGVAAAAGDLISRGKEAIGRFADGFAGGGQQGTEQPKVDPNAAPPSIANREIPDGRGGTTTTTGAGMASIPPNTSGTTNNTQGGSTQQGTSNNTQGGNPNRGTGRNARGETGDEEVARKRAEREELKRKQEEEARKKAEADAAAARQTQGQS